METLRKVMFAKRIIAMNETFAPLGGHGIIFAMLWEESTRGRSSSDILSTFHRYLVLNGHQRRIKLWLDNCSSQNKHWNLFLHFILLINSKLVDTVSIELVFFESGHTFMSADSFHHLVEQSMKRTSKVYTFDCFVNCVKTAAKPGGAEAVVMKYQDFFEPTIQASKYQIANMRPRVYVHELKRVLFECGCFMLQYSKEVDGDLKTANLLTKKQIGLVKSSTFSLENTLKFADKPKGVDAEVKENILKHLVPLMPADKATFWKNLAISN